jgi:ATP-dependent helicase/DNAse subunit B
VTVDLLLAPAGYGKTQYTVEYVRTVLGDEPFASVLVILPNQLQVNEFRRRLSISGGALGGEFVTFYALYAQILARANQPLPRLFDPVQIRLLRAIVADLCEKRDLEYYAVLRDRPGFIALVRNLIQELKQSRVFPEDFSTAVEGMGPRLEELAAVYNAYQDWLQNENWVDAEGQGWLAAKALDENPDLGNYLRLLVVDGFDEINPTQLKILTQLIERAQETLITFTGEQGRARLAYKRFQRAQESLNASVKTRIEPLTVTLSPNRSAALAGLEANLFENFETRLDSSESVEFIEAQTRAEEARAALRWVKARLVRNRLDLSEIAILARDIEVYRPFLEETATEFGIPLRIAGGLSLNENPAINDLLSLLALPAIGWPRRLVIDSWRSPYFDWSFIGIGAEDVVKLDLAARQGRVIGGLEQWEQAFDLLEKQKTNIEIIVDEEGQSPALAPEESSELRNKFESFVEYLTPPTHVTIHEFVGYVEILIGEDPILDNRFGPADQESVQSLNVVQCARQNLATTERDVAALQALKDVLRGLVLAEGTLGVGELDYTDFFEDLTGAIRAAKYSVASESGVLAADVLEARGLSFEAVVLLGLSEGEFPHVENEDVLLWESDRAILRSRGLAIESRLRSDEPSFFYQAVTRARQRLLLSRPYLAEDGQTWEPSPYWNEIQRLFDHPLIQRVRPEDLLPASEAASQAEFVLCTQQYDVHLKREVSLLRSRLDHSARGAYEGDTSELAEALAARYNSDQGWSASRLEAYGTCPYFFFISYALELEPVTPTEEGFDIRVLGSMLHQILENIYRQAEDPADLEECLALLPKVARNVFATAPEDYGFRPTPLWNLQQQELTRILNQSIVALEQVSMGYVPRYFEERFGMGRPSLVLQTDQGHIRLHGYIDRLDLGPDGRLRVVDYKAGGSPIASKDLADGSRLQLPIYALAARDALGLGEISGGFYWHIQRAEASQLKLEHFEGGIESAFETAVEHIGRYVAKIRAGEFQPQPPTGGCPSYCPASNFCWRYKPKSY